MRYFFYLLFACVFGSWLAAAGEENPRFAEDREPKIKLTEAAAQQAQTLRREIAAEKTRLAQIKSPQTALDEQLRRLETQLAKINRALGAIDALLEKQAGLPPTAETDRALDAAASDLPSLPYAARAKDYLRLLHARPLDRAAQTHLRRQMYEIARALIEKPQAQLNDLVARRNQFADEQRREHQRLFALRAQLDALGGYASPAASLLALSRETPAEKRARLFYDQEVAFIGELGVHGLDDLAERYWAKILAAKNPLTNRPLSENLRRYLAKIKARLREQEIFSRPNLRQKLTQLPELLNYYVADAAQAAPAAQLYYEASLDLIAAYFRYAENLHATVRLRLLAADDPYLPLNEFFDEKGDLLPLAAVDFSELAVEKIQQLPDAEMLPAAAKMAELFYYRGLAVGLPLAAQMSSTLDELLKSYEAADPETLAVNRELVQKFSRVLARLRHELERAYAEVAGMYPPFAPQREAIAKAAERYIREQILDYESRWRNDYAAPNYWMLACSWQTAPANVVAAKIFRRVAPAGEKSAAAAGAAKFAAFDQLTAAPAKIDWIFAQYFANPQTAAVSRAARRRGSYFYLWSLTNLARAYYELADNMISENFAREYLVRAARFDRQLAAYFSQTGDAAGGAFAESPRFLTGENGARIFAPYYLYRAAREWRRQDRPAALKFAQLALDAAAYALTGDSPATRLRGELITAEITAFARQNRLPLQSGDFEKMALPLLANNVENAYRMLLRAESDNQADAVREQTRRCRELCLLALARAASLTNPQAREALIPQLLFRYANLAMRSNDYDTARIASATLIREFNPLARVNRQLSATTRGYFDAAMAIMRAAASARVKQRGSPLDRQNLIDALQISMRYGNDDDDYPALIAAYKGAEQPELAAQFIDSVPPENPHYALTRRLGAELYLDETRRAAAGQDFARAAENRDKTLKYADQFIWAAKNLQTAGGFEMSEAALDASILKAELMKILAREAADDQEILRAEISRFLPRVLAAEIPAEQKAQFVEEINWLDFNAQIRALTAPAEKLADLPAQIAVAETLANRMTTPALQAAAASKLSQAWRQITTRAEAENAPQIARQSQAQTAAWLEKSAAGAYQDLDRAIEVLSALIDNRFWQRAAAFGKNIVAYWGSGLYSSQSLFQDGARPENLTAVNPAMLPQFAEIFPLAKFAAEREHPENLAKILNDFILAPPAVPADIWQTLVAAAAAAIPAGRELVYQQAAVFANPEMSAAVKNLLAQRDYLAAFDHSESHRILLRTITEMAFPQTLYPRPLTRRIFTPQMFYEMLAPRGYTSSAGRQKAAIFIAMIDPLISLDDARRVFGDDYPERISGGLLEMWKERRARAADRAESESWQQLIDAVETPLVTLIYGMPDKNGQLIKRDYARAARTIDALIAYDLAHPTPDHYGKLPFRDALEKLRQAMAFENLLLRAKRSYLAALLENGDYATAEIYARELRSRFPADALLTLNLAEIYLAEAQYLDRKKTPRGYAIAGERNPAAMYVRAMTRAASVWRRTPPQSELWWDAYLLMLEIETASLKARRDAKMTAPIPDFPVRFEGATFGKFQTLNVSLRAVDVIAKQLETTLRRILRDERLPEKIRGKIVASARNLAKITDSPQFDEFAAETAEKLSSN